MAVKQEFLLCKWCDLSKFGYIKQESFYFVHSEGSLYAQHAQTNHKSVEVERKWEGTRDFS